jgi:hypothetical protein
MKVTVVPAQITTVEDRIAGSLGLSQLLLLSCPVFSSSVIYIILPPILHGAAYKYLIMVNLLLLCSLLAIRIKGKILLFWLTVILRYNLRPRYYVFNKHSTAGREQYDHVVLVPEEDFSEIVKVARTPLSLSPAEVIKLEQVIDDPAANLSFENKKGSLYVRITEVKPQS